MSTSDLLTIPPGTTVFTHQLRGCTLEELLDAAERDQWPNSQCDEEWDLLRNWAIQTESLMLDEAENVAWESAMRGLAAAAHPYPVWVEERLTALRHRERVRKLAQTNLRYAYGFKPGRRHRLITRAVRDFYLRWSAEVEDL